MTAVDPHTRKVAGRIPEPGAQDARYAGPRLLGQRDGSSLEVWNAGGTKRERLLSGDTSYAWPLTGNRRARWWPGRAPTSRLRSTPSPPGPRSQRWPRRVASAVRPGVAFSPDGRRLITVTAPGAETVSYMAQRDISDAALIRSAGATAWRFRPSPVLASASTT